jgi:hypothetical protein
MKPKSLQKFDEIISAIAWETLSIADIDNLDENPCDLYDRRKIRLAMSQAFLAGADFMRIPQLEKKVGAL